MHESNILFPFFIFYLIDPEDTCEMNGLKCIDTYFLSLVSGMVLWMGRELLAVTLNAYRE